VVNRIKKEHGMQQSIQRQLPAKAGNCVDAKPLYARFLNVTAIALLACMAKEMRKT